MTGERCIMNEDTIDKELLKAIIDFFSAEELVEFLELDVEDIIEAFEDDIVEFIEEIKEEMRWDGDTTDEE